MGKKSSFWLKIKYEQNQQLTNTTASNRCGIGQSSAHPLWAREEVFNDPFGYAAASVTNATASWAVYYAKRTNTSYA
jgi:hypothetical protein